MTIEINPITINGIKCITVKEMSVITNKSDQTIYMLLKKGNSIRRMKHFKLGSNVFIPYTEVVEFPFTWAGKNAKENIYHYTYEGKVVEQESVHAIVQEQI